MPRSGVFNRLRNSIRNRLSRNRNTRNTRINISPSIQNLSITSGDGSSEGRVNDDGTISYPDPEDVDSHVTWIVDRNGDPVQQVVVVGGQLFPYHPEAHTLTKTASEIPVYIDTLGRKVKISNLDSSEKIPISTTVGVYNPTDIILGSADVPIRSLAGKKRRKKTQKKRRSRTSKKRNKNKKR